jgi:subtilase family serine protease
MKSTKSGLTRAVGRTTVLAAAAALALAATAVQAVPYPTAATPAARDIGRATDAAMTVTVMLKSRDEAGMLKAAADLYTPGSPQFHKFLTSEQFHQRFDPSADAVSAATAYFKQHGLTVRQEGNLLHVTGAASSHEAAFGVSLHQFEVPAHGKNAAFRFHAAMGAAKIGSPAVAALVDAVVGLDNHPHYTPNMHKAAGGLNRVAPAAKAKRGANDLNPNGYWTVNDLASYYNVNPLYAAGYHGEGKTIGIVTLASFTPADAYQYWSENGLTVDPNRITVVDIDGGPGPVSDAGGSGETTLDVEQSGGLAPAANVIVYQAPNTDKAFLLAFSKAVNANVADSISVSWGSFEWFETLTRPHGRYGDRSYLKAFDKVFLQAALQGQSMIGAQGDAGAYEANRALPVPSFDPVLSVGGPTASPWMTSAGGTTLPGTQVYSVNGSPFPVTIATEQAWGWRYLTGLCDALGYDPVSCGIFPAGGGGGVSSWHALPPYQKGVAGIRVTEAGQAVVDETTTPPTVYVELPAGFAGRNVPDISLNADPETGYVLDYTDEAGTFSQIPYYGGTSFVAPQLNGLAAVIGQRVGGRVGLLNYPLYAMAKHKSAYYGPQHPFNDIKAGDNWFYTGKAGYDQASGIGTLNVANFADVLASEIGTAKAK